MTGFSSEIFEHQGKEVGRTGKKVSVNQIALYLFPLLFFSTMKDDNEIHTKSNVSIRFQWETEVSNYTHP
jgi:hypothetical protein